MIEAAAFTDLRNYIKKRIGSAKYRVDSTWKPAVLSGTTIQPDGTVRVKIQIAEKGVTINRVAVYSSLGEMWAYKDCNIVVGKEQTGALFWFDFVLTEGKEE